MTSPTPGIVWLNKRSILQLDFPQPHTFSSEPLGWSIRFGGNGAINVRTQPGVLGTGINVRNGDRVVSRGDDLFVVPAGVAADF